MATYGIPLGKLVSFGSSNSGTSNRLIFSGSGTPVSADPDNMAPEMVPSILDTAQALTSHTFPQRKGGYSAMPLDKPTIKWVYYLAATTGGSDAATWADLQTRLNTLYTWFFGTYNYFSTANVSGTADKTGASGQRGDLVVNDGAVSPTARIADAELVTYPAAHFTPGEIGVYQVELTFRLLSHFS